MDIGKIPGCVERWRNSKRRTGYGYVRLSPATVTRNRFEPRNRNLFAPKALCCYYNYG